MSYSAYLPNNYHNDSTKIYINGVELLNRHEISSTQDRELQRFIDNNAHILQVQDRKLPPPPPPRKTPSHKYEEMRRSLSRGPSNTLERYSSMDKLFGSQNKNKNVEIEQGINPRDLPICPNIEGHNYTSEFPGLEYLSDNRFIEDLIKDGQISIGSTGMISQPGSRVGSAMSNPYQTQSATSTLNRSSYSQPNAFPHHLPQYQQYHRHASPPAPSPTQHPNNNTNYYTENTRTTTTYQPTSVTYGSSSANSQYGTQSQYGAPSYGSQSQYGTQSQYGGSQSHYGSLSNVGTGSTYGTLKGGMKHTSTLPPTSPYSSLKRKGVSWLDQERARSLSPGLHQSTHTSRQVQHQYNRPASTIHTTTYTTTY